MARPRIAVNPDTGTAASLGPTSEHATPDREKQIGLQDDHGHVAFWELTTKFPLTRRLTVDGQNVEHVAEDEQGRWIYRAMPA